MIKGSSASKRKIVEEQEVGISVGTREGQVVLVLESATSTERTELVMPPWDAAAVREFISEALDELQKENAGATG